MLWKNTNNVLYYNNEALTQIRRKILIVLMKLKLNLSFTCLAYLFSISPSTCSRQYHCVLNALAMAIQPAIYWPSREENLSNMPKCFKDFRCTRVILDCTEIAIQKCKCLTCRILFYSH